MNDAKLDVGMRKYGFHGIPLVHQQFLKILGILRSGGNSCIQRFVGYPEPFLSSS
jgi:hypothetical protein